MDPNPKCYRIVTNALVDTSVSVEQNQLADVSLHPEGTAAGAGEAASDPGGGSSRGEYRHRAAAAACIKVVQVHTLFT